MNHFQVDRSRCGRRVVKRHAAAGGQAAFTLVELLVTIAIIAILATLVLTSLSSLRQTALRVDGISGMRQIGVAMQGFINDHDNTLPGPFFSGQSPFYDSKNISLGNQLWSYLGLPKPEAWSQEAKILSPKAYEKARPSAAAFSFLMNGQILVPGATPIRPFGYPELSAAIPALAPVKITALVPLGLTKTWVMKDVDQTLPEVASAGWKSSLPNGPIYNPYRLQLYFDWHVEAVRTP